MAYSAEFLAAHAALKSVKDASELTALARVAQIIAATNARSALSYGQKVTFTSRNGRTLAGTVIDFNPKTVKVLTTDGVKWRVSPSLLKAA